MIAAISGARSPHRRAYGLRDRWTDCSVSSMSGTKGGAPPPAVSAET